MIFFSYSVNCFLSHNIGKTFLIDLFLCTFRNAINKQPQVNPWPGDQGLTSCSESSGLTSNSESAFFGDPLYLDLVGRLSNSRSSPRMKWTGSKKFSSSSEKKEEEASKK